jgi:hypothetical protein
MPPSRSTSRIVLPAGMTNSVLLRARCTVNPPSRLGSSFATKLFDVYLLRRPGGGFCFERSEHRTRAGACDVGRLTNNDSMSSPDPDHERMSLTDRESPIRTQVADPRITHGRYHAQSGTGTASCKALGFFAPPWSVIMAIAALPVALRFPARRRPRQPCRRAGAAGLRAHWGDDAAIERARELKARAHWAAEPGPPSTGE